MSDKILGKYLISENFCYWSNIWMSRNLECQSLNGGKVGVLEKFLGNISYIQWGAKIDVKSRTINIFSSFIFFNGEVKWFECKC